MNRSFRSLFLGFSTTAAAASPRKASPAEAVRLHDGVLDRHIDDATRCMAMRCITKCNYLIFCETVAARRGPRVFSVFADPRPDRGQRPSARRVKAGGGGDLEDQHLLVRIIGQRMKIRIRLARGVRGDGNSGTPISFSLFLTRATGSPSLGGQFCAPIDTLRPAPVAQRHKGRRFAISKNGPHPLWSPCSMSRSPWPSGP